MTTRKSIDLANQLRKDILSGKYGTEGGLPGPKELSEKSGYARGTVNRSISLLEGEKLIVKRDAAYYLNAIRLMMTQYAPPTSIRFSNGYTVNLETVANQILPDGLAKRLELNRSTVYRGQISGEIVDGKQHPLQLAHRYYFSPIADDDLQRMKSDADFDPMWLNFPVKLVSHDEVTARVGTQEELARLALPEMTPVLNVFESIRDLDGNLLMAQETTLPYHYSLIFDFPFDNVQK